MEEKGTENEFYDGNEESIRFVNRLGSFLYCHQPMSSKYVLEGFFYDNESKGVRCHLCNFIILMDDDSGQSNYEFVLLHRYERHGEQKYKEEEVEKTDKKKTESYMALAKHMETTEMKLDARLVKALLDTPRSIFLINRGFQRNHIKLALMIQMLSNHGDDFKSVNEMIDMVFKLSDTDLEVLYPQFEKLLFIPPMKVSYSSSHPSPSSSSAPLPSLSPLSSSSKSNENDASVSIYSRKNSLFGSLKSIPSQFGINIDLKKKGKAEKTKSQLSKIKEGKYSKEVKMDCKASGLSLMLAGSTSQLDP